MTTAPEDQPSEPSGLDAEQLANFERVQLHTAITAGIRRELEERIRIGEGSYRSMVGVTPSPYSLQIAEHLGRLKGRLDGLKEAWSVITGQYWGD